MVVRTLTLLLLSCVCACADNAPNITCYACASDQDGACAGSAAILVESGTATAVCEGVCKVAYTRQDVTARSCHKAAFIEDDNTWFIIPENVTVAHNSSGTCVDTKHGKRCYCAGVDLCNAATWNYPGIVLLLSLPLYHLL